MPHVGQFFFDQDLITQVEATSPYNTNTQTLTTNAEDHVFGEQETEHSDSDPVFEYVLLGDDLSDGILAWITVVVNQSATYDPTYSFIYTSSGGVAESSGSQSTPGDGSGSSGESGGPSSGNGVMPSGGMRNSSVYSGSMLSGASGISNLPTGSVLGSVSVSRIGASSDSGSSTNLASATTTGESNGTAATTGMTATGLSELGSATTSVATGAACRGRNILGWQL